MLYLIGIGLGNEKDISIKALEILKNCKYVYLECYTSNIGFDIANLEKLINSKIILASRNLVENKNEIVKNAGNSNVAFLVKGDVFGATTHIDLFLRAKKNGVNVSVLHNSSVLTAVGDTGLMLYNFGKVTSIPFENVNVEVPYNVLKDNLSLGMHTLFLLDLKSSSEFMDFRAAIEYLLIIEKKRSAKIFTCDTKVVVCAGLGSDNQLIKYGKVDEILKADINIYPQCLIVPGKLHFIEEEMLDLF